MKWTKYAVRDAKGRLFTGKWYENDFSATKAPKIWTRRYDAQYRINVLNQYKDREWAKNKFAFPMEIVEVEVSVGEVRPAV